MKKYLFLILSVFLQIVSCNEDHYQVLKIKNFPQKVKLSKGSELPYTIYSKLASLEGLDNEFVLFDLSASDSGIYIFNKQTLQLIKKTGKRGRGPNEIGRYGTLFSNKEANDFYVADFQKFIIWKYNMEQVLENENYFPAPYKNFKMFPSFYPLDFLIRNDTLFTLTVSNHLIAKYSSIDSVDQLAPIKQELTGVEGKETRNNCYETRMTFINGEKMAFSFRYSDVLTITNENFNPIYTLKGEGKSYNGTDPYQDKMYYYQIMSDKNYIYASYLNKPIFEMDEKYGDRKTYNPNCIRIFSWQGEPIAEIYLPLGFTDFYLDRENERIIAFHPEKSHPLHVYNLKDKISLK